MKEYYFYLDSTPSHSYMNMLYKYPQESYPYEQLVYENQRRNSTLPEYELLDTGIFKENRYFDIEIAYAKVDADDLLITISALNRASEAAPLHILPTLWFRNTWSWGHPDGPMGDASSKPRIFKSNRGFDFLEAIHSFYGFQAP